MKPINTGRGGSTPVLKGMGVADDIDHEVCVDYALHEGRCVPPAVRV